jgi:DNA-binding transcriptional MerR regulator
MLIGELADRTGITTSAIRYYEELGLIEPVGRESGRRLFGEGTPPRLRAISAAREAGFSLAEIRMLLGSQAAGTDEWRSLVEAKIDSVEARIERLQAIAQTLRESLDCGCQAWDRCSIVVSSLGGSHRCFSVTR